ncbi:MAG: hypothetical protein Q7T36_09185 [Fluviicoccus sp.]|uniref:hypothetical protein n=1 Tax=Fluviicoccus sp. TaxID=2003552 RepID=UPI00271E645F|nr:hypothetical protein [Fluviicoccus sp.]MDO8330631.1 hypothetical protein [Fluviicoccus sp.]
MSKEGANRIHHGILLTDTLEFAIGPKPVFHSLRVGFWLILAVLFSSIGIVTGRFNDVAWLVLVGIPVFLAAIAANKSLMATPALHIDLTPTHIILPDTNDSRGDKYVELPYSAILNVAATPSPGQKIIVITHAGGMIRLSEKVFPDRDFDIFHSELLRRVKAASVKPAASTRPASPVAPQSTTTNTRSESDQQSVNPAQEALRRYIRDHQAEDPLMGPKMGGREVSLQIMTMLKTERGVNIDYALSMLGALAGYACQAGIFSDHDELVQHGVVPVTDKDGRQYLFGDAVNRLLVATPDCLWNYVAGAAQGLGYQNVQSFDLNSIFSHVAKTVGDRSFGVPRWLPEHQAPDIPINCLIHFWPKFQGIAEFFCLNPKQWHIMFAFAIHELMTQARSVLPPEVAVHLVMESAIPMAKVDLSSFRKHQPSPHGYYYEKGGTA